jgi:hypothetical protein
MDWVIEKRDLKLDSTQIIGSHRCLLSGSEDPGLENHPIRGCLESVTVAVRAERGTDSHDRITSLADFVAGGIGGDFGGGGRAVRWWGFRHGFHEKSGTGDPVRLFSE